MKVINRIKKHDEFNKVIDEGQLVKSDSVALYFLKNELNYLRVGISIPKKSGHAVVRNKMKRQIRAIFAKINDYSKSFDVVVVARKKYDVNDFYKIEEDIANLLEKVG